MICLFLLNAPEPEPGPLSLFLLEVEFRFHFIETEENKIEIHRKKEQSNRSPHRDSPKKFDENKTNKK